MPVNKAKIINTDAVTFINLEMSRIITSYILVIILVITNYYYIFYHNKIHKAPYFDKIMHIPKIVYLLLSAYCNRIRHR